MRVGQSARPGSPTREALQAPRQSTINNTTKNMADLSGWLGYDVAVANIEKDVASVNFE
jgi:hypothetical protein